MNIYVCIDMYIYIHTCVYIYPCVYMYTYFYIYIYTYVHIYICVYYTCIWGGGASDFLSSRCARTRRHRSSAARETEIGVVLMRHGDRMTCCWRDDQQQTDWKLILRKKNLTN